MSKISDMLSEFYMQMEGENSGGFGVEAKTLWENIEPYLTGCDDEAKEHIVDCIMSSLRQVSY